MNAPRILITNSVPLNGGDEALLRATVEGIGSRFPESRITVLCSQAECCRSRLPDLDLHPDLEQAERSRLARLRMRWLWHLRRLGWNQGVTNRIEWFTASGERRHLLNLYQEADLVISSAGGFLHDFYHVEDKLRGLELALGYGKPVMLLAQSIGPFWRPETLARMRTILPQLDVITVRDTASRDHLALLGLDRERIDLVGDAAFLWRELAPELYREHTDPPRRIGLSFRAWPVGDADSRAETVRKGQGLARHLLTRDERSLHFLSTCQGVPEYVDDAELAEDILAGLPEELRNRCTLDRNRYSPRELITRYAECDAFVGMRLHGSLLAMLGGTPAFGLGYEDKTREIFGQMGLGSCQARFDSPLDTWLAGVDDFLASHRELCEWLPFALDHQQRLATRSLDIVERILTERVAVS